MVAGDTGNDAIAIDATQGPRYEGVYLVPQVTRILTGAAEYPVMRQRYDVDRQKLLRWVRAGLTSPDLADVPGNALYLTFQDLISMRIIAALRAAGVAFPRIRAAEAWLRGQTGQARPFASEALWTARAHVFAGFRDSIVAASKGGQIAMEFVRDELIPLSGLIYRDGIAATWEPRAGVLLDPLVQFGAPCVRGTRIPTRVIWGMIEAGDTPESIADAYDIALEEVCAARDWENSLAA